MPSEFSVQTKCCALPTHIVDPGYPVNSIGEGSVILQVGVNARGSVERVRVVRPEPSLTEAAVNAVRNWKFATDRPASVVVVISFQRPVLSSSPQPSAKLLMTDGHSLITNELQD